ncbi:MAG: DUF6502 family protein [Granulosicoccus sp.]
MSENQHTLLRALAKLIRPLVRIFLHHGITCEDFVEVVRRTFVTVAEQDFPPKGRKQSLTNIAFVTGIHRHDVKKLKHSVEQDQLVAPQHHRMQRVISGWLTDPELSKDGVAKTLDIDTEFKRLVSKYSGDITPRPILDELLRVGAVEKPTRDTVTLLVPAYVPHTSDIELIRIFGDCVADLIATLDFNMTSVPDMRRLQLSVVHDNLPDEVLSNLESVSRDKSLVFLKDINQFFETQDRDANPNVKGKGRNRAGIGLYYFQEKIDENDYEIPAYK